MSVCGEKTEVYSRVCGYFRPVSNWNKGKKEEFKERRTFEVQKSGCNCCAEKKDAKASC
ncbi:MAG: hypothetical protein IKX40_05185 [Thermoguttaceae bacterium]|nr:hypothetical protein [Thermoguttaceae bacterium]